LAAAAEPEDAPPRFTDEELAAVFPWMAVSASPAPPAAPAAAAAPAAPPDDGDDGSCVICLDRARTAALEPCGHALLCHSCAAAVLRTAAPACPVCRARATGFRDA
jgi:hypothetical protein